MRLNRKDLRKIQYDFNSYASRLLQADFEDYNDILRKFLTYISDIPVIFDYIKGCGTCELDLEQEVNEVRESYGQAIFSTGETENEEVRNVYATLKYIVDQEILVYYGIAMGYSHSNKYQDKIKGFNDRFVMVLIRHIERHLTKVGIDMGVDEKIVYNVTVEKGQAIIATDGSTVNATNQVGTDGDELAKLIAAVQAATGGLAPEDKEAVQESLEVIEVEASAEKPKKSMLKTAISTLTAVKGVAEFGAAVAALAQFIGTL